MYYFNLVNTITNNQRKTFTGLQYTPRQCERSLNSGECPCIFFFDLRCFGGRPVTFLPRLLVIRELSIKQSRHRSLVSDIFTTWQNVINRLIENLLALQTMRCQLGLFKFSVSCFLLVFFPPSKNAAF